ncbi:DNA polymerase III subunit chi [Acidovorax sp. Leaf76]|uniref:DNA polymerase III subunit chi n=1 Tax=unclassified Acidovorax TaxID=2684926 RepID=UPI0006F7105A|nr:MULTISPECIES: DNA polymerase III subunit chi [unclassified Acidovorax]KQO23145.1 DNA polymerase III subunit chi [Acidovorax sp. Leaf76]KQO31720.1 DNA polymerase III subunit chi [Acidovorax sp. Leaf84]KQS37534.1 DNA polymerase III subunit chi [Acidovorax sp. Leaf191]
MTEVAFHFNAPDKLAYACRFARKVQRSGARLVISAPADTLVALDRMLWALAPQDFVAHCRDDADEELVHASPVLLAADARTAAHHEVLLNLHAEVPEGFGRFDRLVEVVSAQDESDRMQARARWKHYASRGYAITRHDLVLKAG